MNGGSTVNKQKISERLKWIVVVLLVIFIVYFLQENPLKKITIAPDSTPITNQHSSNISELSTSELSETNELKEESVPLAEFSIDDSTNERALISEMNTEESYFCLNQHSELETNEQISTLQACEKISNRLASVNLAGCNAAKLKYSQCNSVSGFPILYREFTPLDGTTPQARILVIGGTHGDELTSVSIVFRWIETLNKHHSGLFHWHVVPMMNPDGVLKKAASRTNQNGIDLNRNLPTDDWQENALKYWRERKNENPRRYPGEQAASEPETQWLVDEINSFKPDAIISVHAPYGMVDFDSLLLDTAPKSLGKLHLNMLGTYPGSLGNYAGINRNIPVVTLELPHAWVMPTNAESSEIWEDIINWLRNNIPLNQANASSSNSNISSN